jgi:D-arabinose 5-phosphate isomerase GutQ
LSLIAKLFATNPQLGKQAFVIGESTTPSIQKGDLFIVISGSGSTEHLRLLALMVLLIRQ